MKATLRLSYHFLIALSLLMITACQQCQSGFTSGATYHHQNQTHEYDPGTAPGSSVDGSDEENGENIDIRDIWQKPSVVLDILGDLEDKVVADIGAGPYGYFSLRVASQTKAKKVIAIDIDQEALDFIDEAGKALLPETASTKLEARLATDNDPKLQEGEADIILIVNTTIYFEDRLQYFRNLQRGLASGGHLVVIEFKKKKTPFGPHLEDRVSLGQLERDLLASGYELVSSDDKTLEFQYIITAIKKD
ncbi:MAG: class I SAM-dependent methyltransferase [Bacteroidota bacterium]